MNHLHRIILIHSASVEYQEMTLDGNVHLMGKNGMGKSSLLRAMLFFYTADPQGLGLKPNQVSFPTFYLPHPYSWLVYEVHRQPSPFLVLAFRDGNRVSFRFVNGTYDPDLLLDRQGRPRRPAALEAELQSRGLEHSPVIDRYETYRDILYGTYSGAERSLYRRYSLFEASHHAPVWHTLAHIFRNARLEASFLKRSLIDGSREQPYVLDLRQIRQALTDFARHRSDLLAFRAHEAQAAQLLAAAHALAHQETRQRALAEAFGRSYLATQALHSHKRQALATLQQEQADLQQQLRARQQQHEAQLQARYEQLGALRHQQATAQRLAAQYAPLAKAGAKKSAKNAPKAGPGPEDHLHRRLAAYEQAQAQRMQWQAHYQRGRPPLVEARDQQAAALAEVEAAIREAETKAWLTTEIADSQERHLAGQMEVARLEARLQIEAAAISQLEASRDQALAAFDAAYEARQAAGQAQAEAAQARVQALEQKLAQLGGTFYNWLEDRYPDWEQTIGKVVREEILFHPYLAPQIERLNDLLYGVRLDLDEVEAPAHSPAHLEQARRQAEETLAAQLKALTADRETSREKRLALEKRYNRQKIRAAQQAHKRTQQELDQWQLKVRKEALRLQDLRQQAQQAQQAALLKLSYAQATARQELNTRETALAAFEAAALAEEASIEASLTQALAQLDAEVASARPVDDQSPEQVRYAYDQARYLDRLPALEAEIGQVLAQIEQAEGRMHLFSQQLAQRLEALAGDISAETEALARLAQALEQAEAFRDASSWLPTLPTTPEAGGPPDALPDLIHLLQQQHQEQAMATLHLRRELQAFFQHFRPGNVFGFPEAVGPDTALDTCLQPLEALLGEGQIADYEQDLHVHYAQLADRLSQEVRTLDAREAEIGQLIERLNRSFREHNFVGVVKGIELRMEETSHPVVTALRALRQFGQDQAFSLGGPSLFNPAPDSGRNQEAIALLDALQAGLEAFPGDDLHLEDTFRLAFRVRENQNDTGWVEQLSQAGSHGTDVLVKAMVYITLLSVIKQSANRRQQGFRLHCLIDEAGILDAQHLTDLIAFANARDILLVNGAPQASNPLAYQYIYHLSRDGEDMIRIHRLLGPETS